MAEKGRGKHVKINGHHINKGKEMIRDSTNLGISTIVSKKLFQSLPNCATKNITPKQQKRNEILFTAKLF